MMSCEWYKICVLYYAYAVLEYACAVLEHVYAVSEHVYAVLEQGDITNQGFITQTFWFSE